MMETKILHFLLIYSCLLLDTFVLSDDCPSVSELQKEMADLKAHVEDLNSKVEFILKTFVKGEYFGESLSNTQNFPLYKEYANTQHEKSPVLLERLKQIERILTDAPEEIGPQIYVGTQGGGIKAVTDVAHDVRTIISSDEDLEGVAYDPVNNWLYYCSYVTIYRANNEGTDIQIVFNDTNNAQYGIISGLSVDWITGNLYAAARGGYIFVCDAAAIGSGDCTTILTSSEGLLGIAVSPNEGKMYYTSSGGKIMTAEMDGSNEKELISGLQRPAQIAVDYGQSRLFWVDVDAHRVQSSTMAGGDMRTLVQLPENSWPWGVAVHGNKLYWGSWGSWTLQSSTKTGENIRTLLTAASPVQQLALTTRRNLTRTRVNDCDGQVCSNICVLTSTAFRCLV